MKFFKNKALLALSVVVCFLILMSASSGSSTYDKRLRVDENIIQYRGKASDTVTATQTTFTYTVFKRTLKKFEQYWEIGLDSVAGSPAATSVAFQSRHNLFNDWTTDTTVEWAGTSSDTTIVYHDDTDRAEPYRRVLVTYAADFDVKVDWVAAVFTED